MSTAIPDLWPMEASVLDVLSPLAIARFQASQLRLRTHGLLEAEVNVSGSPQWIQASFDVVALPLDRYRMELFRIGYSGQKPYPVNVYSENLCGEAVHSGFLWADPGTDEFTPEPDYDLAVASSQEEFIQLLTLVFASRRTRSILQSMLARINEARLQADPATSTQ